MPQDSHKTTQAHAPAQTASTQTPVSHEAAVGKITQIIGKAEIIHADGTQSPATVNAPVHQGDVIQTADKGGVNILFEDNTTFAISENARMSVDQFTYDAHDHSGSTFFSMLQGMFVYTSGLVGKHDIGHVGINTPVGSIGIRGTVVAGDIHPAGQDSHITIVDGAIVVTNDGGSLLLDHTFDTAQLSNFATPPQDAGQLTAQAFSTTYDPVHGVAAPTFDAVSNGTYHTDSVAPATLTPHTDTTPPAHDTTAPVHDGLLQLPGDIVNNPQVAQAPQTGATFGSDAQVATFDTSTHDATSAATLSTASAPVDSGTVAPTAPHDTSLGTAAAAPVQHIAFAFASWYGQDGGIPLFDLALGGQKESPASSLGTITAGPAGTDHYTITMTSNVLENALSTPPYATVTSPTQIADALSIVGHSVVVNNPYAMANFINGGGIDFTVHAYSAAGAELDHMNYHANFDSSIFSGTPANVYVGDPTPSLAPLTGPLGSITETLVGTGSNDLIVNRSSLGSDTIISNGGFDTIIGSTGKETIILNGDGNYQFIDGKGGGDILQISTNAGSNASNYNLTAEHHIYNINNISIDQTQSNTLTLDFKNIFDMVGTGGTLNISTPTGGYGANVTLLHNSDPLVTGYAQTGVQGTGQGQLTISGAYNGHSVTLVIEQGGSGHGAIAVTT